MPAPDRALGIVDQVRRRMLELSQQLTAEPVSTELATEIAAELGQLADQLGRVQGLLTTGDDPLGGTYRTQIAALRRWLRAQDLDPEPPVASEHVLAWLAEQRKNYAASSVRKAVAAVRSWHRAVGAGDPTDTDEIKALIAGLGEAAGGDEDKGDGDGEPGDDDSPSDDEGDHTEQAPND